MKTVQKRALWVRLLMPVHRCYSQLIHRPKKEGRQREGVGGIPLAARSGWGTSAGEVINKIVADWQQLSGAKPKPQTSSNILPHLIQPQTKRDAHKKPFFLGSEMINLTFILRKLFFKNTYNTAIFTRWVLPWSINIKIS